MATKSKISLGKDPEFDRWIREGLKPGALSPKKLPAREPAKFARWSVRFGALSYNDGTPNLVSPELVEVARELNRARVVLPKARRP